MRSSTAGSGQRRLGSTGGSDRPVVPRELKSGGSTEGGGGAGTPIWVTFNEGKGGHTKPWVIHQVRVQATPTLGL